MLIKPSYNKNLFKIMAKTNDNNDCNSIGTANLKTCFIVEKSLLLNLKPLKDTYLVLLT